MWHRALALLALAGCQSFLWVDGPEPRTDTFIFTAQVNGDPSKEPICTDGYETVYLDTAFALAFIPIALLTEPSQDGFGTRELAITSGIILGGLSLFSAVRGARTVSRCRDAKRAFRASHPAAP